LKKEKAGWMDIERKGEDSINDPQQIQIESESESQSQTHTDSIRFSSLVNQNL